MNSIHVFVVSLACTALLACRRDQVKPENKDDHVLVDKIGGSCYDFNFQLSVEGVTWEDQNGNKGNRIGKAGTTVDQVDIRASLNPDPPKKTTETVTQVICGCNNKIYDDVQKCLDECKVTLGCFTNICGPAGTIEKVCLETKVKIFVKLLYLKIFVAEWDPPAGISDECRKLKEAWDQKLRRHEQRHYNDILDVIKNINDSWKDGKTFTACGKTYDEAKQNLEKQVLDTLDAVEALYNSEKKKRSDEWHQIEPEIEKIDCEICR